MLKVWLAIFNFALLADNGDLSLPAADFKRVSGDQSIAVADSIVLELEGAQNIQSLIVDEQIKKEWVDAGVSIIPPDEPIQPYRLTVIPLKAGEITIPSLFFKNNKAETFLRSNPFTLSVQEFRSESKEPPPQLLAPLALSFPKEFFFLVGGLLLLIVFTVYLEWKEYIVRKEQKKTQIKKIKLPEDEVAMMALSELERSEYFKKFIYKKIYFSISEILKAYLGARYRFDARESTSREVIAALENQGLSSKLVDEFSQLFKALDLIKFTDTIPADSETKSILLQVKKLIELTKKPKVVSESGVSNEVR